MRTQHYSFGQRNIESADIKQGWGPFVYMRNLSTCLPKLRSSRGYGSRKSAYYMQNF